MQGMGITHRDSFGEFHDSEFNTREFERNLSRKASRLVCIASWDTRGDFKSWHTEEVVLLFIILIHSSFTALLLLQKKIIFITTFSIYYFSLPLLPFLHSLILVLVVVLLLLPLLLLLQYQQQNPLLLSKTTAHNSGLEDAKLMSNVLAIPLLIVGLHTIAVINLYIRVSRTTR